MRGPQQILTIALALSPLAAAWSKWLPDIDSLVVRQDDESSSKDSQPTKSAAPESSATNDAAEETGTSKPTQSTKGGKNDDNSSGTSMGTTKGTGTGTSKTSKTTGTKHTTFNVLDPAGGVAFISPPTTSATLYRIDNTEPITWVWNYTSLQGTPSAVDVLLSCSKATATWTLSQNMTFAPTATFTWDSNKFQQQQVGNQLPVEQYTLIVYDADGSFTDSAQPGYLAPYSGFTFGLYTAKPYSNLSEWKCTTCSAAGALERQAVGFVVSMTMLTVLGFTWYVTGIAALI
ncbi:hypothetical protein E0Z10_g5859 [Xylaria hypoxylon]|uniref:DUF7137 domain-containing protein n=1 Tax=Xylaria hypoxylon TaxID=37992 RepID=A0A4Z0YUU0_9PEZI|nr:hypothetical protein E0Z10_g5859 [Xylaria hypoxylon]